ncbi:heavy-metal-associated domain-containing protein [Candidatus Cyanaurora vandensis]|uniref:heavy-metal-associated domain-containing protein n=1 Tax=Candidatus Cyanaurora vandensis TaxID=2714958 RepID=UPI0025805304|nr:heavy metal-associated domain-containing protein [Candidatus Cyanaurora vandensis]
MPLPKRRTATLNIQGMSCAACVERVERRLSTLTGVEAVTVDLSTATAQVTYYPHQTTPTEWATPLAQAGYPVTTA